MAADGLVEVDTDKLGDLSKSLETAKTAFDTLLKGTVPNIKVMAGASNFHSAHALQSAIHARGQNVTTLLTNISNAIGALQTQLDAAIKRYVESSNDLGLITDLRATIDNAIGGHLPGLTDK
jgi:hypothetical protein